MPIAVFKSVREASSEDAVHKAENLLKQNQESSKKWKTKALAEKCAYVVLELERPQQITGIDIGNEHAAFVEVLVGRAGCKQDDFTEILITCSFMTPVESKNSSNTNRVRCFNREALVSTAASSKWQVVKVICTQPFNRHVQYGLSFIKVHITEEPLGKNESKSLVTEQFLRRNTSSTELNNLQTGKLSVFKVGKFNFREDSPDSESETSSALFNRWKNSRNSSKCDSEPSAAASIRQASSPVALRCLSDIINSKSKPVVIAGSSSVSIKNHNIEEPRVLDRNREKLLFGDDDETDSKGVQKHERLSKQIETDRERLRLENEKLLKQKDAQKNIDSSLLLEKKKTIILNTRHATAKFNNTFEQSTSERTKKRFSSPTGMPSQKKIKSAETSQYRPFNQLLSGVVLVISGIQNPDRADLRRKALALGAKYKADWEQGCTHLICAFKNTPKFNQVRGIGKIITRSWIDKCYALRKYLPWRRYALESAELAQPESDEELLDESLNPMIGELCEKEKKMPPMSSVNNNNAKFTLSMYDLGTERRNCDQGHAITSDSDTEDEIIRVKLCINKDINRENLLATTKHKSTNRDVYEVTTEEEEFLKDKLEIASTTRTFFKQIQFYICADIGATDKIKLEQFVRKYGGSLTQNLLEAHYAVSHKALEKSECVNFAGEIVLPLWIYECNDMESRVPTTRYLT